jgi:hypothetical protein
MTPFTVDITFLLDGACRSMQGWDPTRRCSMSPFKVRWRFGLYAEIDDVELSWGVHLASRVAAHPEVGVPTSGPDGLGRVVSVRVYGSRFVTMVYWMFPETKELLVVTVGSCMSLVSPEDELRVSIQVAAQLKEVELDEMLNRLSRFAD